ncbi:unnamed protein product [Victoria cruziana]
MNCVRSATFSHGPLHTDHRRCKQAPAGISSMADDGISYRRLRNQPKKTLRPVSFYLEGTLDLKLMIS